VGLKIISAEERLAEIHPPKILIAGPSGVGKTSLLRTVDPASTLFIDCEAGGQAVQDVPVDTVRIQSWPELVDIACFIGGADPTVTNADDCYSAAHYARVCKSFGDPKSLDKYGLLFVDSLTQAMRLCLRWCADQPEAKNRDGVADTRGMYGMMGRQGIAFLDRIQKNRAWAVCFVAILEFVKDQDANTKRTREYWELQLEGQKVGRELPGIMDQVIAMGIIDDPEHPEDSEDDAAKVRALCCTPDGDIFNSPNFTPKDRSGRLGAFERPHLGDLIGKLTARPSAAAPAKEKTRRKAA
jgi:hypothetical protein